MERQELCDAGKTSDLPARRPPRRAPGKPRRQGQRPAEREEIEREYLVSRFFFFRVFRVFRGYGFKRTTKHTKPRKTNWSTTGSSNGRVLRDLAVLLLL